MRIVLCRFQQLQNIELPCQTSFSPFYTQKECLVHQIQTCALYSAMQLFYSCVCHSDEVLQEERMLLCTNEEGFYSCHMLSYGIFCYKDLEVVLRGF